MARLFGTDGVRGPVGERLTAELTLRLAAATAVELLGAPRSGDRPLVVVGRDTRPSGPALEAAAAAGFASVGCDVALLGVVPTPAVALETAARAELGLMISASHNPAPDNGLKLFDAGGGKLPDAVEDAVEARVAGALPHASGTTVGTVERDGAAGPAYVEHLLATVGDLRGLSVVVDGAQGAASVLAPEVYRRAGARVVAIHADGDGTRINDGCGATHPASLAAAVREHGADLGIAHDGDADRCVVVDGGGEVLSGDQVLAVLALARLDAGAPGAGVLVATVMSNLGLLHAMRERGVRVVQTAVGDRYVLEAMHAGGHLLGGEQSGHVIQLEHATTGDGLLTALQVMQRVVASGRSVRELASVVVLLPQVLVNVRADRERAVAADVLAAVALEEGRLAGEGRVLLRPSGTEPLVRVMVEAPTAELAREVADRLAAVVGG